MRLFGTIVVGIVMLLGSAAQAQLPVVKEARADWQGCAYSIKVLQGSDPYAPWQVLYRVTVQSAVVSSATCALTPRTVELGTSKNTPEVAIVASADGLAAAWTYGEYIRGYGTWGRARIHRLDPSTLSTLRLVGLQSNYVPSNGGAGMPGVITLSGLTLNAANLEVAGTFTGNSLTEDPATTPWPYPILQGNHFVATYADFFTAAPQSPSLVTF
ncbi:hypothetical protein ATI61_101154 [Archangium gephyra]|uniref:Uncharacterized protein n=2 Tax=Archangium gephyra TaxID=48 RepID=A0ABX9KAV5_9BACT|nr:hypothetical protein [Archangium gephyra]REG37176.1 hypothetical protein ATI61_101154 [Archangium gephyra]